MYQNAGETLEQILSLVSKCPEALKEKCFEILLKAYVDNLARPSKSGTRESSDLEPAATTQTETESSTVAPTPIPDAIKSRLVAMAGRMKVPTANFAGLFDFQLDPFNYHALAVPGSTKAEKARNVALLLAAKAYLTTGTWTADWKEFRAVCVDQNCFDPANYPTHLKNPIIKSASASAGITLSGSGVTAAETLIRKLMGAAE